MDRNTLVVTVAIFLIGSFTGFHFVYRPKMAELRSLEQMQKEEKEKKLLGEEVASLKKKISEYREKWLPPSGKEEIELLNRVREIANGAQVRVISMVPEEVKRPRKAVYRKFSLTISFEGTYHHLGDFISKVENEERMMKIDAMEFSILSKQVEFPLVCKVTLSLYLVP